MEEEGEAGTPSPQRAGTQELPTAISSPFELAASVALPDAAAPPAGGGGAEAAPLQPEVGSWQRCYQGHCRGLGPARA